MPPRQAVVDTRAFLPALASTDEITVHGLIRTTAMCLLRHYPLNVELRNSYHGGGTR
ncbi:BPSL0761 family protein [Burkholderia cepacia]|uniref:BPSL0761 family protein n=1 Tax=Burkholderia cepacia TaxID=292 RepID=UPI00300E5F22